MWINSPPYPSVPAAQDLTWASSLSCHFAQFVGWNGKPSPSSAWLRRWKQVAWINRLFGRTCGHSTAARGVKQWIALLRATRANRSASLVNVVDTMIHGTFGRMSTESLAKLNQHLYFSKTCPATSASGSIRLPPTLKAWATKLRQVCLARKKLVLAKSETGSSSSLWMAPNVPNGGRGLPKNTVITGNTARSGTRKVQINLNNQAREAARKLWGTPADYSKGGGRSRSGKRIGELLLPGQAKMWRLPEEVAPCSLPGPTTSTVGEASAKRPRGAGPHLNPVFVGWLMGWPEPNGFGFSATEWSRYRQRMRSALFGLLCTG